jgi:hypothetical protein
LFFSLLFSFFFFSNLLFPTAGQSPLQPIWSCRMVQPFHDSRCATVLLHQHSFRNFTRTTRIYSTRLSDGGFSNISRVRHDYKTCVRPNFLAKPEPVFNGSTDIRR